MRTSAIAACIALTSIAGAARADEAVFDGTLFRVPDGTGFFRPRDGDMRAPGLPHGGPPGAGAMARPTQEPDRPLFMSVVREGAPFVAVMREPPGDHPSNARRVRLREGLAYEGDVAGIRDADVPGDGPGRSGYLVRTGIDFAPEAEVTCFPPKGTTPPCRMLVVLGGRFRMGATGFALDVGTPASLRRDVRAVIEGTLPDGMRPHDPDPEAGKTDGAGETSR